MSDKRMQYRPEIDGLRAVAVLPVIWHHAGLPGLPGGFLGVDVFFVISGYLITGILLADLSSDRFSIARFYERRARRLFPALVVTIVACIPMAVWLMLPGQLIAFGESLVSVTLFLSNVHFWRSTDYFAEAASLQPLLHTWSLAVEEQFYLFYPLALLLSWRLARRGVVPVLGLMAACSFALAIWASYAMPVANFYLLPTRAWELLAGALCVFASRPATGEGRLRGGLATLGLVLVLVSMVVLTEHDALPGFGTVLTVSGTCLVLMFCHAGSGLAGRILSTRVLVAIGLVSYSAYLFHQPLFAFARIGWPEQAGTATLAGLGVLSLVLAGLSWRFVEQPFRRPGARPLATRRQVFGAGAATGAAIALVGIGLILSQGLAMRYAPEDRKLALFDRQVAGAYVRGRFNERLLRPFDHDGRPSLLILGDSFGQDFMNVLAEAGLADQFSIFTHHVSRQCGNLLASEDLSHNVPAIHAALCAAEGGVERAELIPLISAADVIVLASDWQPWQWPYLADTVTNLTARTDAEVYVLGRKNFGTIWFRALIREPAANRPALRNPPTERQRQADAALRGEGLGDHFIDVQGALCPDPAGCPLFTPEGALISYDGGHLTRAGAVWAGERVVPILPFVDEAAR